MSDDEIKTLEKAVKKAKRIASERASELHDLVEDRLPAAFDEIPASGAGHLRRLSGLGRGQGAAMSRRRPPMPDPLPEPQQALMCEPVASAPSPT